MIGDLYIDNAMLERTRGNLASISDILESPTDEIERWGTGSAGVQELSDRLGEFDNEWDHGIEQLRERAGNAAETLEGIKRMWDNLDMDLTKALRERNRG